MTEDVQHGEFWVVSRSEFWVDSRSHKFSVAAAENGSDRDNMSEALPDVSDAASSVGSWSVVPEASSTGSGSWHVMSRSQRLTERFQSQWLTEKKKQLEEAGMPITPALESMLRSEERELRKPARKYTLEQMNMMRHVNAMGLEPCPAAAGTSLDAETRRRLR